MPVPLLDAIFRPFREGQPAVLVSQRSMLDLVVDEDGKVRPLIEAVRREGRQRYGMACVTYALATGVDWESAHVDDERDRRAIEGALRAHRLLDIPQDQNEVVRVIRGIASLSRSNPAGLKWANGDDLRFAFLLLFAEHLTPGHLQNGTQTEAQIVASELAHITAQSLALRSSSNYIIFHGDEGLVDTLVCSALRHVRLRQPDVHEKERFLEAALAIYPKAAIEPHLTRPAVATLTSNTPNRGLESLLRASHRAGRVLTARDFLERKSRDVEQLSEGTLTLLDTEAVEDADLYGRSVSAAQRILARLSRALLDGDRHMPANVLLAGPPGTGKTQLAKRMARDGQAAAYLMNSPKSPYVGQTERLARQQQFLLTQWTPNVALCDEITEAFPLERSDFDGDSGASRAVMAQLLTSLSDESRRGRSLLVATTNCPWRIGAAMRSRFTVIPVLHPLLEDYPGIIAAVARQVSRDADLDAADGRILEAARIYYEKGANPRHVRGSLGSALLLHGHLDADVVRASADDFCGSTDLPSALYADYWAIACCSSRSFLPWAEDPSRYPCPPHLVDVVDVATGAVRQGELRRRIAEMKPHANL
jgi:hypothetical protein